MLTTPIWFVAEWSKNQAATRSLCVFTFSGLRLERDSPTDGWILAELYRPKPYGTALAAFVSGLPTSERGRLVSGLPTSERGRLAFAPKLPKKHRAWAITALGGLGTSL